MSNGKGRSALAGNRRRQVLVGLVVLVVLFFVSPHLPVRSDPRLAVPTAVSLLTERDVDLDEFDDVASVRDHYGYVEVGGRHFDYFPWVNAVPAVPWVVAYDVVVPDVSAVDVVDSSAELTIQRFASATVAALAAVTLAAIALTLLNMSGNARPASRWWSYRWIVTIVAAAVSTALWSVASRGLWQHGPSMLCLAGAVLFLLRSMGGERTGRWDPVLLGAFLAAAVVARPTNVVSVAVVAVVLAAGRRWRVALEAVLGAAPVLLVFCVCSLRWFGGLPPYYAGGRVGWHSEFVEATAAQLVSPARGLVVFFPYVALAALPVVWRSAGRVLRLAAWAAASAAGGYALVAGAFGESWWAGDSYGPRFMSEALVWLWPVAFVATIVLWGLGRRCVRGAVVVVWAVSVALTFQGAWFQSAVCWNGGPPDISFDHSRVWEPGQLTMGFATVATEGYSTAVDASCEWNRR